MINTATHTITANRIAEIGEQLNEAWASQLDKDHFEFWLEVVTEKSIPEYDHWETYRQDRSCEGDLIVLVDGGRFDLDPDTNEWFHVDSPAVAAEAARARGEA